MSEQDRYFSAVPRAIPIGLVTFFAAMAVLILLAMLRNDAPLRYWSLLAPGLGVVFGTYYLHCLTHRPVLELTADTLVFGMTATFDRCRIRVPIERIRGVRRTAEDRIELETDDRLVKLWLGQIAAGERDAVFDAIRRRVDARGAS